MAQANTDDGNSFDGRIWVTREQREWVNDHKQGSDNQADVVDRLIDFYETHDPDADAPDLDADELAEKVSDRTADKVLSNLR